MLDHFEERIKVNNAYYDVFAGHVAQRTETRDYGPWLQKVCAAVPVGGRILDIGCGTGLHMSEFRARGFEVIGIEPSAQMRRIASAQGLTVLEGAFETLDTMDLPNVHAIWCASSLLHVPSSRLTDVLLMLRSRLLVDGVLYITVRLGEGSHWDDFDDTDRHVARFIQLYDEASLSERLMACGYRILTATVESSYWGRPVPWLNLLAGV